jgi:hypothetical protein
VRQPRPEDAGLVPFGPAEGSALPELKVLRPDGGKTTVNQDVATGRVELAVDSVEGFRLTADGLTYEALERDTYSIVAGEPLSAAAGCERTIAVGRGEWQTRVETRSTLSADAERFHVSNLLDAYEGPVRVFARAWTFSVPRDLC